MATAPTRLQSAAPFLLTSVMILVGATLSTLVIARARLEYDRILKEAQVPAHMRTVALRPENLAEMGNWLIDAGGMFGALTGPAIGLALLYERFSEPVILLYSLVILLSIAGFALFVGQVSPRGYPNRPLGWHVRGRIIGPRPLFIFTPVVMIGSILNLSAGLAVLVAGP